MSESYRATISRFLQFCQSNQATPTTGGGAALCRVERGTDIRTLQELLGHKDVATTQIYTHVLNKPGVGVRSPLD